jgi:hypothetical protein
MEETEKTMRNFLRNWWTLLSCEASQESVTFS